MIKLCAIHCICKIGRLLAFLGYFLPVFDAVTSEKSVNRGHMIVLLLCNDL